MPACLLHLQAAGIELDQVFEKIRPASGGSCPEGYTLILNEDSQENCIKLKVSLSIRKSTGCKMLMIHYHGRAAGCLPGLHIFATHFSFSRLCSFKPATARCSALWPWMNCALACDDLRSLGILARWKSQILQPLEACHPNKSLKDKAGSACCLQDGATKWAASLEGKPWKPSYELGPSSQLGTWRDVVFSPSKGKLYAALTEGECSLAMPKPHFCHPDPRPLQHYRKMG
jgi:hypothetical protein